MLHYVVSQSRSEGSHEESKAERVKAPTQAPSVIEEEKKKIQQQIDKIHASGVSSKKRNVAIQKLQNKLKGLDDNTITY